MTTTLKSLEAQTAAEARLVAAGVMKPRDPAADAELEEVWTKLSQAAIRSGLPMTLDSNWEPVPDLDRSSGATSERR